MRFAYTLVVLWVAVLVSWVWGRAAGRGQDAQWATAAADRVGVAGGCVGGSGGGSMASGFKACRIALGIMANISRRRGSTLWVLTLV
jgi:hypothetical protein